MNVNFVNRHKHTRGFTLVEMIVFIVVVAVSLVGVIIVINNTLLSAPEALVNTRAMELSQLYLDEVLTKKYDEQTGQGGTPVCDAPDPATTTRPCTAIASFGPDAGETRNRFDDVDDYHATAFQAASDAAGNPLPNYTDYQVSIGVTYAGTEIGLADDRYAKRITITVRTPRNQDIPVTVYRVNY